MPNPPNVAHNRLVTITHDRTFNGKPLYYHKDGLILEYLEGIDRVLSKHSVNTLSFVSLTLLYVYRVISMETIPRYSVVSFGPWSRKPMSCA